MRNLLYRLALPAAALCSLTGAVRAGVDSVVTFNEIQYHPAAAQTAGEWIELKNQNSADVDLSGWRLDGGVDYVFSAGTVIKGGKYLVIAANPSALMTATGLTGVLGPFANVLNNNGESVTLKNNNGRRMDEISWNDKQPWPVAADGSGATLAKIEELHDSGSPENWRASVEVGGTPGVYNFTEQHNGGSTVSAGTPGTLKHYYKLDGNTTDGAAGGVNGQLAGGPGYVAEFSSITGSGQSLDCNGSSQSMQITDAVHPAGYTIMAWVKPDTIKAQSIVVRTDGAGPTSSWSHQIRMTAAGRFEHYIFDGAAKMVTGTTVAVAGQWYHVAVVAMNGGPGRLYVNGTEEGAAVTVGSLWTGGTRWLAGSNSGHSMGYFDGKIDELAFWFGPMSASQIGHIATGFRQAAEDTLTNHALGRAVIDGSGAYPNLAFNGVDASGDFSAGNVTDGSASDVYGGSYWLGRQATVPGYFTLDLGNPVEITRVLLRNTHNAQLNNGGTANFTLSASASVDGAKQLVNPVEILSGTLAARTSQAPIPADSFTSGNGLTSVTARYLRFDALTSAYAGGHAGLNEIEVFGTALTGGGGGDTRPPVRPLVINELTAATAATFWIELLNHGAAPLAIDGFVIATDAGASFTLPAATLPPGGFITFDAPALGFTPADGDKIFLYSAARQNVIDGALVKLKHQARRPGVAGSGPGEFLTPSVVTDITRGEANHIALNDAVVINEIMYHHRPQFRPFADNDEEWIELYNRSGAPVVLDGWQFDEAISYIFPPGTTLAPGAYLVVSNNTIAFTAAHPGVPAVGNFSAGLSNRGERIILRDTLGNAVDTVFYRDKEPWPIYTDGLGSSLELKNPDADNSLPESWAASDESTRSSWQDYTFTASAATPIYSPTISSSASATTAFHELRMGLLEDGEVLVDEVSVRDLTAASGTELIQNGAFTAGTTATWRILGNHETSGIFNDGGNNVLQIRALGPLLYMHNLLETSLKTGASIVPVVSGHQYKISLRAKWLRGCPWLHTEFYYNKVAKTFLLDLPAASGTPGAQNSTWAANTGPGFSGVIHAPLVPNANQAVTVTARITDPQGVGTATLRYSVNGAASFSPAPMTAGPDGVYTGTIPGQGANAITQFYIEASDAAPAPVTATWPATGPASRALIKVNEGAAVSNKQNLRVITTAADASALANSTHMMSNRLRGCTIIHNEREVFYNGSLRLRGSMYSRSNSGLAGESIHFPADHLFRGTQRTVSARRSGMNEIFVKHAINRAGGLPDNYNDVIQLISFRSDIIGPARMEMERFNNSWLDEFYPEGSDGTLFKLEGIRDPSQTFGTGSIPANNPEGIKNYTTSGMGWVVQLDLADLGPDGEQYRHGFRFLNNFSRNDNARFVQMCRAMSLPVSTPAQALTFEQTIEPLMDVDEWMRCFAMMSLFGIGDVYSQPPGTVANISNPHNLNFYMPPVADGKVAVIPWDWNSVFAQSSSAALSGDKNIQKVIGRPRFKRLFLGNLKSLIDTSFNAAYMGPWLTHYGSLTGEGYTGYTANINARITSVLSQINAQIPSIAFSITTNGGAGFPVDGATTTLEGKGWVDVRDIRLNGSPESLAVTWQDQNTWRVTVPLGSGINVLNLTAHNRQGVQVGTDSIAVTNTSIIEQAGDENIAISELHYHPAGAAEPEFIEVMNISPDHKVDLSGCLFTAGVDYSFPAGTILDPGARLVVTAAQFLNGTALNNAGERITLEGPGGVVIRSFAYSDQAPWPAAADGGGPSLVLIAPLTNPDHTDAANWRASTANGGNAGADDALHFTGDPGGDDDGNGLANLVEYALGPDTAITFEMSPLGLTCTVPRMTNADDAAISAEVSTALAGWEPADLISSTAASMTFRVPAALAAAGRVFIRANVTLRQ